MRFVNGAIKNTILSINQVKIHSVHEHLGLELYIQALPALKLLSTYFISNLAASDLYPGSKEGPEIVLGCMLKYVFCLLLEK